MNFGISFYDEFWNIVPKLRYLQTVCEFFECMGELSLQTHATNEWQQESTKVEATQLTWIFVLIKLNIKFKSLLNFSKLLTY